MPNLKVILEPTSLCNIKCIFCNMTPNANDRGNMSFDAFEKIVNDLKDNVNQVYLWWRGEPLLHPRIVDMVSLLTKNNMQALITTNAQLLTKDMMQALVDAGLVALNISTSGATKGIYEQHMKGASFETYVKNVTDAVSIKADIVELRATMTKYNMHEIELFENFTKSLNIRGTINCATTSSILSLKEKVPEDLEVDKLPNNFTTYPLPEGILKIPAIAYNGDVGICFFDPLKKYTFGNCITENFMDIYNKKEFVDFRDKILNTDLMRPIMVHMKNLNLKNA